MDKLLQDRIHFLFPGNNMDTIFKCHQLPYQAFTIHFVCAHYYGHASTPL